MAALSQIWLLVVNVLMAYYHHLLISKGKRIYHGWWGFVYLLLALPFFFFTEWLIIIQALLLRKFFFDVSLNLLNGFDAFRLSNETTSIFDKINNFVFRNNGVLMYGFYYSCCYLMNLLWLVLFLRGITLKTPVQLVETLLREMR